MQVKNTLHGALRLVSPRRPPLSGVGASRGPVTPEEELTLRLCARSAYREAAHERIITLAERSDPKALSTLLERSLLLPLVGSRLAELAPHTMPEWLTERVSLATRTYRHRAVLQGAVMSAVLAALERAGIAALPLKGVALGEAIYGDPGLRFAGDLDLLVHPADLPEALRVLQEQGYGASADLPWENGLPLLHYALPPERRNLPPLELHWRIHWIEAGFSQDILARAAPAAGGGRSLQPADDLAALLLFYARNSFFGLKLAADLAAWWDAKGHELPAGALDPILAAHPELRGSIRAALLAAEQLVGLPAAHLASAGPPVEDSGRAAARSGRAAARLANWRAEGEPAQQVTNLMAIDWLLTPRGLHRSFVRRYMYQPSAAIAATYGRAPEKRMRNELWRIVHGASRAAKFGWAYCGVRYAVRGGRTWSPRVVPPPVGLEPGVVDTPLPLAGAGESPLPLAPTGESQAPPRL